MADPIRVTRRGLLGTALLGRSAAAPRRPSVVLVVAEGWRAQALKAAGDTNVITPHVDRLVRESLHLTRAYSACPETLAGRSALLNGAFPHRARRDAGPTLLTALKSAGYVTAADPDSSAGFLRRNIPNDFCLYLELRRPAGLPEEFAKLYDPARLSLRDNVPYASEDTARRAAARYYAQCSAMDAALGRILETLDDTGLAPDTIFAFTADCGEMLGSHGLDGAGDPREESAAVPLILRYPRRLKPGAEADSLFSGVDLAPTLLGFCGLDTPQSMQGRDLSDLLLKGEGDAPESIYAEGRLGAAEEWRMIVRGLDKLVVNTRLEATHLYNLGQDPYELTNLAAEPTERLKRDELRARLRQWVLRTGDRPGR